MKIDELVPDSKNANKGTERGRKALDTSLRQYGAGRSILVDKNNKIIAGNKTVELATVVGIDDVVVVETDGTKLVAVKRTDLDLEDNSGKARALAVYDNRVGELDLDWDLDALSMIDDTVLKDLWKDGELAELAEPPKFDDDEEKEYYSRNIEAPIYKPMGEKPAINELYNTEKTKKLIEEINSFDIPEDEKEFLKIAATRHTIFNYKNIAEYYAQSNEKVQELMENSALVIIDFNRAIELGYVRLSNEIAQQYDEDYPDGR